MKIVGMLIFLDVLRHMTPLEYLQIISCPHWFRIGFCCVWTDSWGIPFNRKPTNWEKSKFEQKNLTGFASQNIWFEMASDISGSFLIGSVVCHYLVVYSLQDNMLDSK